MDESKRRAVKFLEKEMKTYRALALFLSKNNIKRHSRAKSKNAFMAPGFYQERMKEAKKLVFELKKQY
jgi:hypothetical protein